MEEELRSEPLVRELIAAEPGAAFYSCDVRGVAESEPQTTSLTNRGEYNADYFYSSHALTLDYPYIGQRTFDVLRVLDWLTAWDTATSTSPRGDTARCPPRSPRCCPPTWSRSH
ncbi:MAG: hypothetical protein H0U94_03100 [Acidobacteria bacterium]|nr:hypothetical protein [Acidobacteriota bacterium]